MAKKMTKAEREALVKRLQAGKRKAARARARAAAEAGEKPAAKKPAAKKGSVTVKGVKVSVAKKGTRKPAKACMTLGVTKGKKVFVCPV